MSRYGRTWFPGVQADEEQTVRHRKALTWIRPARDAVVIALVTLLALPPSPASAAPSPADELRNVFAAANRVLNDPRTADRPLKQLETILGVVSGVFAFREAAERALGRDWHARTDGERDEFTRLFANLLERAFVYTLAARAKLDGGMDVGPLRESIAGGTATVLGTLVTRDGGRIPVEYQMIRRHDHWLVRDVLIEGSSVIASYRAQIARVMQTSSFDALVSRMRERLDTPALVPAIEVDVVGGTGDRALARGEPRGTRRDQGAARNEVVEAVVPPPGPDARIAATAPATPVPPSPTTSNARATSPPARRLDDPGLPGDARAASTPPSRVSRERPVGSARPAAVPAAPPRVAPTSASTDTAERYWVQVGAFKDARTARQLGQRLRGQRFNVSIDGDALGDALVRVRVGPFGYRSAAVATLHVLESHGFQPFVLATR